MIIEKKININNIDYYIGIEVKYHTTKNRHPHLTKKDGTYYDGGDLSYLIEYIEKKFERNTDYDKYIAFMNDIIYIYDRIPFLSYIKDISYKDNKIKSTTIIYKEEIIAYIKENNIEIGKFDGLKSVSPLLFNPINNYND